MFSEKSVSHWAEVVSKWAEQPSAWSEAEIDEVYCWCKASRTRQPNLARITSGGGQLYKLLQILDNSCPVVKAYYARHPLPHGADRRQLVAPLGKVVLERLQSDYQEDRWAEEDETEFEFGHVQPVAPRLPPAEPDPDLGAASDPKPTPTPLPGITCVVCHDAPPEIMLRACEHWTCAVCATMMRETFSRKTRKCPLCGESIVEFFDPRDKMHPLEREAQQLQGGEIQRARDRATFHNALEHRRPEYVPLHPNPPPPPPPHGQYQRKFPQHHHQPPLMPPPSASPPMPMMAAVSAAARLQPPPAVACVGSGVPWDTVPHTAAPIAPRQVMPAPYGRDPALAPPQPQVSPQTTVVLRRRYANEPLGLSLAGAAEVQGMSSGGLARASGLVQIGDRVISVNGVPVLGPGIVKVAEAHARASRLIREAQAEVHLTLLRTAAPLAHPPPAAAPPISPPTVLPTVPPFHAGTAPVPWYAGALPLQPTAPDALDSAAAHVPLRATPLAGLHAAGAATVERAQLWGPPPPTTQPQLRAHALPTAGSPLVYPGFGAHDAPGRLRSDSWPSRAPMPHMPIQPQPPMPARYGVGQPAPSSLPSASSPTHQSLRDVSPPRQQPQSLPPPPAPVTTLPLPASTEMPGALLFVVSHAHLAEALRRGVVSLPTHRSADVRSVAPQAPVFLFDEEQRTLHGVFAAATAGELHLAAEAVGHALPTQLPINTVRRFEPLEEGEASRLLEYEVRPDSAGRRRPRPVLSGARALRLLQAFVARLRDGAAVAKSGSPQGRLGGEAPADGSLRQASEKNTPAESRAVAEQLRAYLRANGGSALGTELTEFYRQITPRAREVIRSAHAPTQNNSGVKSLVLLHPDLMRMENGDAGRIFALP